MVVWTVVVAKGVVVVVGNDFIIKSLVVGAIALRLGALTLAVFGRAL